MPDQIYGMDCRHIQFCVHTHQLRCVDGVAVQELVTTGGEGHFLDLEQLQHLFQLTAFWARSRSLEDLAVAIANSDPIVSVWDQDRLVGFARATSDGIYRATLWDVVIHPDYQGAGLGRKMVETVLMHPRLNRVERVYLMTTNQQKFYDRIGFQPNRSTTMVLFNQLVSETAEELSPCDRGQALSCRSPSSAMPN